MSFLALAFFLSMAQALRARRLDGYDPVRSDDDDGQAPAEADDVDSQSSWDAEEDWASEDPPERSRARR